MRLNKYIASASGMSRRSADAAIQTGRVRINGRPVSLGQDVKPGDTVRLDGAAIEPVATVTTIMLNKPVGHVVSRKGQGAETIYTLLPAELHHLKPVGRLDKDSSGLLLLTTDGRLHHQLTHPSFQKQKTYEITLNKELLPADQQVVTTTGVPLSDGASKFDLKQQDKDGSAWQITMHEGRNRQIRRTFEALGYTVTSLHRTQFGEYILGDLEIGAYKTL